MIDKHGLSFVFVLLIFCAELWESQGDTFCITSNEKGGSCVVIKSCEPVLKYLQKLKNDTKISESVRNYLKSNHCGFEDKFPKICCNERDLSNLLQETDTLSSRLLDNSTGEGGEAVRAPEQLKVNTQPLLPNKDVCGPVYVGDRVFGGDEIKDKEFPWLAQLHFSKAPGEYYYGCGALLISNRYLLTAGHCTKPPRGYKPALIKLGEWDEACALKPNCTSHVQNYGIEEIITHERFSRDANGSISDDIALIRLNTAVNFTDWIHPICLPTTSSIQNKDLSNLNLTVAGWGKTKTEPHPPIAFKVTLPFVKLPTCHIAYKAANLKLSPGQFCAGAELGRDACRGDSGTPLMIQFAENGTQNWYAMGITSFGLWKCGTKNFPGVYTDISEYMQWILEHMKT